MFVTALSLTVNYLEKNVDIHASQDRNWNMNSASFNWMIRKSKDRRYRECLWMLTRPKVQWTCLSSKPIFFSVMADVCVTTCTYINQMSPGLVHKCTWTQPYMSSWSVLHCIGKNSLSGAIRWASGEPKCTVPQSTIIRLCASNNQFFV